MSKTKIDVISGFLGAGKTTLIKKLLEGPLKDSGTVLIENEFGEIGIDGGFLKDSGIEIKEMNSGCICCSLAGDFGTSLREVLDQYHPPRIIIEPSGVGKLSDVLKAVESAMKEREDAEFGSAVTVVDASKAKVYAKNFGEFFINQIEHAGTIELTRSDKIDDEKMKEAVSLIRSYNKDARVITTALSELDAAAVLNIIEGSRELEDRMLEKALADSSGHHHHHHEENGESVVDEKGRVHHHHHHHDHDHEHHHDHDEHEHHHDHDEHEHHHDHDEHGHHHDHDEHEHHHDHDEHGHHHDHDHEHHHDADEVFESWGLETPEKYTLSLVNAKLDALDGGNFGVILRAKGMVPDADSDGYIYFDYVPGEKDVRVGEKAENGLICVIGSHLKDDDLDKLFELS
ncbi:MAG: GTP-binding protein [Lachnospiraceae bacterium]|nr:GTP-binding protein [Lachnospiraceae bacterium]